MHETTSDAVRRNSPTSGSLPVDNQDVSVGTYRSRVEAELLRTRLQTHGIEARIVSDDVAGAYPALEGAGVHLFVFDGDSERALGILSEPVPDVKDAPGNLAEAENAVRGPLGSGSFGSQLARGVLLLAFGFLAGFLLGRSRALDSPAREYANAGTVEIDHNLDGRIDAWHDYEGELYVRTRFDRNLDGESDAWNFLENGVIVRSEIDENFDGDVDGWLDYEFGNTSVYVSDLDRNGVPDSTFEYRYGIPVLSRLHPNRGRLEREGRFADGQLREVYSVSPDGTRTLLRSYDALGRLVPETR